MPFYVEGATYSKNINYKLRLKKRILRAFRCIIICKKKGFMRWMLSFTIKSERQLLNIINILSKQYGIEVKVDIEAKEEGGIKDKIIAESALFLLLVEKVLDIMLNPDRAYLDNTKRYIKELVENETEE